MDILVFRRPGPRIYGGRGASEKDRDAYLPHPEHKAFGKVLGPVMDDVFVIDFWSHGRE